MTAATTTVKAVHVTELRTAVANLRALLGLSVFPWTDDPLTPGVTVVKAIQIAELRTALDQVYDAFPKPRPTYTDPILTGLVVKAVHLEQLRTAVLNVINDAPAFTKGADQTVSEDAAAQTIVGWATAISPGARETTQTVTFFFDANDNPSLFSAGPSVASNGTLTYTPAANQNGVAHLTLHAHDDGGTGHGGVDNSATQPFVITVNAVNDAPVVTNKNANAQANMRVSISNLLTGVTDADSGVNGCAPTFSLAGVGGGVTSPAGGLVTITNASTGVVDFDPPPGVTGNVTFTYTVSDTGCPGTATSLAATVTVSVAGPVIWFVDSTAPGGGNGIWTGTNAKAFQTVAQAAAVDASDHRVFVLNNNASSINYANGIALNTGEWLIGQGATNSPTNTFDALMGITPPAGTVARPSIAGVRPTLQGTVTVNTQSASNVVKLLGFNLSTSAATGLTNGGTTINGVTVNLGSVSTTTGTAVSITGTSNGTTVTNSMTFVSVSADGAANGIDLNNATGSFTVTGDGNTSVGGNSSGGTIQNTTIHGVSVTNAQNVSLTNMNIHDNGHSGIDGQQVTNFTFKNGTINNVGTAAAGQYEESNIGFNDGGVFTSTDVSGTVTITNNILTNARRHGIDIENGNGTISNLTVSGNTLTSSTNAAVSLGTALLIVQQGSVSTASHLTTGTINGNTITNFPSGEGIAVLGGIGNATNNTSATLGANGTPIAITNNTISGQVAAASHLGSNAIRASINSQFGVMNVTISCNGNTGAGCTATGPITNIQGQGISVFAGGSITGTATIDKNVIVANQTLGAGTQGLAVQVDDGPAALGLSAADYNVVITNNNVSAYEGFGIRGIARASPGKMDLTIQNNTAGAPTLLNRSGIRVDSGSAAGDVTMCRAISGNTSAGSGVNQGIGLRKQGTIATVNDFGIVGLSPSPTTGANAAARVNTDNPGGSGVDIISGDNFVSCTITP